MQPIKIIHLLPSNRFSGAEHVILQIMELFKDDPKYEMWYVGGEGPIRDVLDKRKVKYRLLPTFSYGEIKQVISAIKPDIIHAHDVRASVMAALFGKHSKVISHIHVNWPWMKKINAKTLLYAMALPRMKQVLGVSQSVCDEYVFGRKLKNKFVVLPNVLDEKTIYQKAEEFSIQEPIDLLFVGRLTPPKKPLLFLGIVEELVKKGLLVHAVMLGDGELKKDCHAYITQHHLEKYVSLKGFVPNPYPYMKATKLLVMTSCFEGFGLVAVEAMLLNTPVVGTPAGGLKDILLHTQSVIAQKQAEFVSAIVNLLNNPAQLAQQAQIAQQHIKTYTDLDHYKETITQYYQQILECKDGR